jgi:hypothetical protein
MAPFPAKFKMGPKKKLPTGNPGKKAKMAVPKADKKGTPDFQRNPRSAFKNKPKGLTKARGKKV